MKPAQALNSDPYVGPRPFELDDRDLFFGREREAHEVSSLVLANKLFMLYAASGAGKTSLVNAGVLPLVQDELEILPTARFQAHAPRTAGRVANVYTQAVLSKWAEPQHVSALVQTTLAEFLADRPRLTQPIGPPLPRLLVFDQFEELFTTHPTHWPERREFLEQLAEASELHPDLRVLIVLREDFLSRMLNLADAFYSGLKDRYYLEPLRRQAAELSITSPVRNTNRSFEPAAVNELIRRLMTSRVDIGDSSVVEVEGEFVEPVLLQIVCQTLWKALPPEVSTISLSDVRTLADVNTSLASFYSDTVRQAADLGLVSEDRIREWVQENLLTHPGGTRAAVYAGAETTEGLPNEVVSVLEGKLLRAEFRAGARWLEITHDSLLGPIEQSNRDFFRSSFLRVSDPTVTDDADRLAVAVKDEWTRAAAERGLLAPEPIPVRWARPALPLAGPRAAAAASRRFPPLPGLPWSREGEYQSGEIRDLHTLYGGLGSGRLVIAGAPGSGKTTAGVLLILLALRHREEVAANERPLVPVPVMLTMHGWDPMTQPVQDWLVGRLQHIYPLFAGKRGAARGAGLIAAGKVTVILDGLDEIPDNLRPVALRALSQQATFRMVILTRSVEMANAAAQSVLEDAAAVELQGIDPVTAAEYLIRVQPYPSPVGWRELADRLHRSPDGPIAQALDSPLTLTLVRDIYSSQDDIFSFLAFCDSGGHRVSSEDIVDYLMDRILPVAYARRPGQPPPRYDLHTAQHVLYFLAARMNQDFTRDLRWWRIPAWTPRIPRAAATGLAAGLAAGLMFGLGAVLVFALEPGLLVGLGAGLCFGLAAGFWNWRVSEFPSGRKDNASALSPVGSWRRSKTLGLRFGLVVALVFGVASALVTGLTSGLTAGITFGLLAGIGAGAATALTYPETWSASVAFVQLAARRRCPIRLMRFLEDARYRSVLRTVGPVYQFRHARLQDLLALQAFDVMPGLKGPQRPGRGESAP